AAFENRTEVTLNDVLVASELALSHRTREGGFLEPATPEEVQKTFTARAEEVGYAEKSERKESQRETIKKPKGRAVFWDRGKLSKKAEEKLRRSKGFRILSTLGSLFRRLKLGISKRLRRQLWKAPLTRGTLRGAPASDRKPVRSEVVAEKTKGIPTVNRALTPPKVKEGLHFLSKIREKAFSSFKLFLKKPKKMDKKVRSYAGKRAETVTALHRGRPRGWRFPHGKPADMHLPATIRAAARRQKARKRPVETALKIGLEDVREKLRLYKAPMTLVFVIDLSGSMILNIDAVREALLKLHGDAYRYRDRVGIVALKEMGAIVVQHPITNLRVVANKLLNLKISGFTPLASGMLKALEVLKEAKRRDRSTIPVMVIVTDGNTNVPLSRSLQTGEVRHFDILGIAYRKYVDLAVEDVINVSEMIKREGIHTVVVNTNPYLYGEAETRGYIVTKLISSITKGRLHIVGKTFKKPELVEKIVNRIAEDQRMIAHEASLDAQRNR
ncbi:MAG: VWA domain-containing protein, partial [Candidatus Bathyarchaeia archaeon]